LWDGGAGITCVQTCSRLHSLRDLSLCVLGRGGGSFLLSKGGARAARRGCEWPFHATKKNIFALRPPLFCRLDHSRRLVCALWQLLPHFGHLDHPPARLCLCRALAYCGKGELSQTSGGVRHVLAALVPKRGVLGCRALGAALASAGLLTTKMLQFHTKGKSARACLGAEPA
jgi:hypothetical protein